VTRNNSESNLLGRSGSNLQFPSVPEVAEKMKNSKLFIPYFLHPSDSLDYVSPYSAALALQAQGILLQAKKEEREKRKEELINLALFYASLSLEKGDVELQV